MATPKASRSWMLTVNAANRLDALLLPELRKLHAPDLSRATLKEVFRRKEVLLQGRPALPSCWLEAGCYEITWLADPAAIEAPRAAPSRPGATLPVVYESPDLLILNKPSGLPSRPLSNHETETAVGAALAMDPALAGVGRGGLEPGLLHRLDTGTSGLLAFARTPEAFDFFSRAWKAHSVRKIYRALAAPLSVPQTGSFTARLQLGHDAHSPKRMRVQSLDSRPSQIRGRPLPTLTHIRSRGPLTAPPFQGLVDFEIEIETGVMHQIRCTLAHLGSPLLGDPLYGGSPSTRLWLHAWKLRLPLMQGGEIWIQCELPPEWPPGD